VVAEIHYGLCHALCDECKGTGWEYAYRQLKLRTSEAKRRSLRFEGDRLPRKVKVVCDSCGGSGVSAQAKELTALLERAARQVAGVTLPEAEQQRIEDARSRVEALDELAVSLRQWDVPTADGRRIYVTAEYQDARGRTCERLGVEEWNRRVGAIVRAKTLVAGLHLQTLVSEPLPLDDARQRVRRYPHWKRVAPLLQYKSLAGVAVPGQGFTWGDLAATTRGSRRY